MAYGTAALGLCHRANGEIKKGILLLQEAVQDAEARDQLYELGIYQSILGALVSDQGVLRSAQEILQQACDLLLETGSRRELAVSYWRQGFAYYLDKKYEKSVRAVEQAALLCNAAGAFGFMLPEAKLTSQMVQYLLQTKTVAGFISQFAQQLLDVPDTAKSEKVQSGQTPPLLGSPDRTSVEVFAFGDGMVFINQQEVPPEAWESEKAKELFFFLAMAPEIRARKEEIITALWPDSTVEESDNSFHAALHRARRATDPNLLVYRDRSYGLSSEAECWLDVSSFNQLLNEASDLGDDNEARLDKLVEATKLYKTSLLPWCFND